MPAPAGSNALSLGRPLADLAAVETIDDVKDVLGNIIQALIGAGWPCGARADDIVYQNVYYRDGDFYGGVPSDPVNPDLLLSAAGGTIVVQEEGVALTARGIVNFIGASVTAVDNAGATRTDVTITGGTSNSFETIVTPSGTVVADSAVDTLTLANGPLITISGVAGTDTITVGANFTVFRALVNDATDVAEGDATFLFDVGTNMLGTAPASGTCSNLHAKAFVDNENILVFGDGTPTYYGVKIGTESFKTIAVSGQSDVAADKFNDTLTLVAGSNVTLTQEAFAPAASTWDEYASKRNLSDFAADASYLETLPLKMSADVFGNDDLRRRYQRINELATGGPLRQNAYVWDLERPRKQAEIDAELSQMKADGFDDPVQWMQETESREGSQWLVPRMVGEAVESVGNTAGHLVDLATNDRSGSRARQIERGWAEGVEDVKDERSWLPNWVNEVGRASATAAPQLAAAAGVTAATKNPAAGWMMMLGPSGAETFAIKRAEGMSNAHAAGYAAVQVGIEFGTAKLFGKAAQKMGLKTFEEVALRTASQKAATALTSKQLSPALKLLGGGLFEGGEEGSAEFLQKTVDYFAGLSPDLFTKGTAQDVLLSMGVGIVMGGAANVPAFVAAIANPSRRTFKDAGLDQVARTHKQRTELAAKAEDAIIQSKNPAPESLRTKPPVEVVRVDPAFSGTRRQRRSAALKYGRDNIAGNVYRNRDATMDVSVSVHAIGKAISDSALRKSGSWDHVEAVQALPQLIERAVLTESRADQSSDPNIRAVHRFYAPLLIGESLYRVKLTVMDRIHPEGKGFYTHELTEIEMPAVIWTDTSGEAADVTVRPAGISTTSISDLLRGAMRDDGTPILGEVQPPGPGDKQTSETATVAPAELVVPDPSDTGIISPPSTEGNAEPSGQPSPTVPSPDSIGILPKSALQLDAITANAARAVRSGKRWLKQNFLSGGEQNEATRNLLADRDGTIRKHLAELSQNSRDLKTAAHKAYNIPRYRQLPDTVAQAMGAALKDQTLMNSLPVDVAVELQKMRDHVDGLSQDSQDVT